MDLPIYRQTPLLGTLELNTLRSEETEVVRAMLNDVILEGVSYPQSVPLSPTAFSSYWLKGDAFVIRRTPEPSTPATSSFQVVGAFYIKPNFPGRCSHICNAGFIVAPQMRGQGLGRWMAEAMLELARDRGYRAVMYNLVFATNLPSLKLWESVGFREIGRIPDGVRLPDGDYTDAIMLYKSLT